MASDKTKCLGGELPVKRLANVVGVEGKQNDVIVCPSEVTRQEKQQVIFFGGDIQVCITHSSNFLVWLLYYMYMRQADYFQTDLSWVLDM